MASQKIVVPNIGDFKDVEIIEVLVNAGQKIKKNDSIITLESDKSSVEVPSPFEGKISELKVKIGDKVSEGSVLATLEGSEIKEEDKQSVFLEIDPTLYTVSSNSLIGHLLDLANVINIAGDVEGSYPQISLEFIVDKNPSIILLNDTQYGNSIQDTLNRDGWSNIEAIKSKKVFALNADWVSRAGPRTIKGLEQIITFVYGVKLLE